MKETSVRVTRAATWAKVAITKVRQAATPIIVAVKGGEVRSKGGFCSFRDQRGGTREAL